MVTIEPKQQVLARSKDVDLKNFFFKGQWKSGGSETTCGGGSTVAATESLRNELPRFLRKHGVLVFLDAPCGDFAWMKLVDLSGVNYIGMDIVEDFTRDNKKKYESSNRRFITGDITKDVLPPSDMMLVRDCLFHLPYLHIFKFFRNFLKCDIPNLLTTTNPRASNKDIARPGMFRHINLCRTPFNLPTPMESIADHLPGKVERTVAHWTAKQIRDASVNWPAEIS